MLLAIDQGTTGTACLVHVWRDADAFLAAPGRAVLAPGAGQGAAQMGLAGRRRAVRAAPAWARDDAPR